MTKIILRGALYGILTGIVFGLFEVFFTLALVEDLFRQGIERQYVLHGAMAVSMVVIDALFGLAWGLVGGVVLVWLARREGPFLRSEAYYCFWCAVAVAILYPTYFLYARFLADGSRYAPFWLPITIVWLGVAAGIGALLFYVLAVCWHRAGSLSLNLFVSITLSVLVLGGAYANSRGGGSFFKLNALMINAGLFVGAIVLIAIFLRAARLIPLRRGLAAVLWVALGVGVAYHVSATRILPGPAVNSAYATPERAEGGGNPNVFLIVLDTQRVDRLGIYNSTLKTSPNLDALAKESMVYERCVAPTSWTLPSHASLFTGLYPTVHGADYRLKRGISPLNPDHTVQEQQAFPLVGRTTVTELLHEAGYSTAAVCGNCGYLHPAFGMKRGFDFYDARMPQPFRNPPVADLVLYPLRHSLPFDYVEAGYAVKPQRKTYRVARSVAGVAGRWLDQNCNSPMFMFLNFCDPHAPYAPPYAFDQFSDPNSAIETPGAADVAANKRDVDPALREHLLNVYDGEILYMDHHIGELVQNLKAKGIYDSSLIIVTADHGEYFGEHGRLGHGGGLHEPVVHVPLIVKYPNARTVGRNGDRVSLVDIAPTILEEVGLTAPAGWDGAPLNRGDRPVVAELQPSLDRIRAFGDEANCTLLAWYEGPWKLVRTSYDDRDPEYALFNLEQDPGEERDVYTEQVGIAAGMIERLTKWHEAAVMRRLPIADGDAPELEDAVKEGMRNLGYTQGSSARAITVETEES